MGVLYYPDGSTKAVAPKNGTDYQLAELYELLGTDVVQVIPVPRPPDHIMILDEEGKLKGAAINSQATHIAAAYLALGDFIVGVALVTQRKEFR